MTLTAANSDQAKARKLRIATTSLAGCFGCHMSILDIDERILQLANLVEFDRSPIDDIKHCGPCDIGIIEGAVCNSENVHVLREFRKNCKFLVAMGACAINGGLPALRNHFDLKDVLTDVYTRGDNQSVPNDTELPLLLEKVHPLNEVVRIDYFLPGCPPSADTIWAGLKALLTGQEPKLPYGLFKYE